MNPASVLALISGEGTNLQALIEARDSGQLGAAIRCVISNNPDAKGLERAKQAGIETLALDHRQHSDRAAFDLDLATHIDRYNPDLIVLAGYMRILGDDFVHRYLGRMINIHPSLLPKYPGLNTHRRAIENGDKLHGATVHFVTPALDAGPAIVQGSLETRGESEAELARRVRVEIEHHIYPLAVSWFVSGRLRYADERAWLDGEPLPPGGVQWQGGNCQ